MKASSLNGWSKERITELLLSRKSECSIDWKISEISSTNGFATKLKRKASFHWDIKGVVEINSFGKLHEGLFHIKEFALLDDECTMKVSLSLNHSCKDCMYLYPVVNEDFISKLQLALGVYTRELQEETRKGMPLQTDQRPKLIDRFTVNWKYQDFSKWSTSELESLLNISFVIGYNKFHTEPVRISSGFASSILFDSRFSWGINLTIVCSYTGDGIDHRRIRITHLGNTDTPYKIEFLEDKIEYLEERNDINIEQFRSRYEEILKKKFNVYFTKLETEVRKWFLVYPDGRVFNKTNWSEKNATPWSLNRLRELLSGYSVEDSPIVITIDEVKKIDGEATANNLAMKPLVVFEWVIEGTFVARVSGSEEEYKGKFDIPNLSDENEASEVDLNTSLDGSGPLAHQIRQVLNNSFVSKIQDVLGVYIRELKEEFSKGLILPTDQVKPQVVLDDFRVICSICDYVEQFKFNSSTERVFEAITETQLVRGWTNGSIQEWNFKEGGTFSLFGGNVTGTFEKIEPNKEIVKKWRLKKYPNNHHATIHFTLKDNGSGTDVKITAKDVPTHLADESKSAIHKLYSRAIASSIGSGTKEVSVGDTFKATPERVFEAITETQLVRGWTNGSIQEWNFKEGGMFSLFGGNVTGTFEKIEPNKEIVKKWRLKKYPKNHHATIHFTLKKNGSGTDIKITAKDVPTHLADETQSGLDRYYLTSIARTFGFSQRI